MKFLLDAQLPSSLKEVFLASGHDCLHTSDLPLGNDTPDKDIAAFSIAEQCIVITKDSDFYDSFLLKGEPYKLILVKLGNTSKAVLRHFFETHLETIITKITSDFILILDREH